MGVCDFFKANDEKCHFPVVLAPMVGISHVATRTLLRSYLPKNAKTLWPTEMLNSRRIPGEKVGFTAETFRLSNEDFLIPQILGNDEEYIRKSIIKLTEWGAHGIDINMGCPVNKALKHNYGVALMGDPAYAKEVVQMCVRNSNLPISVKLRATESGQSEDLLKFVNPLIEAGASWLTLHPRKGSQKRRGVADWSQIQFLKSRVSVPIIGNGDIQTAEDVENMFAETNCDAVMIGRALTARPWIFWQLSAKWGFLPPEGRENQRPPETPEEEAKEYGKSLIFLLTEMLKYFPQALAVRRFRFYVKTGCVWLDFGQNLLGLVTKYDDPNVLIEQLQIFFEKDLRMLLQTDCRQ